MDHYVNPVDGNIEESRGFEHFEPLIHQRRRVHGDLGTHRPSGMLQCGLARHLRQLVGAVVPEGPTRGREEQSANLGATRGRLAHETLVNSAVFGVNG